jgi:hypothetical protein
LSAGFDGQSERADLFHIGSHLGAGLVRVEEPLFVQQDLHEEEAGCVRSGDIVPIAGTQLTDDAR